MLAKPGIRKTNPLIFFKDTKRAKFNITPMTTGIQADVTFCQCDTQPINEI